jgi:hypothetical protein
LGSSRVKRPSHTEGCANEMSDPPGDLRISLIEKVQPFAFEVIGHNHEGTPIRAIYTINFLEVVDFGDPRLCCNNLGV